METPEPAAFGTIACAGGERRARTIGARAATGVRTAAALSCLHALPSVRTLQYTRAKRML